MRENWIQNCREDILHMVDLQKNDTELTMKNSQKRLLGFPDNIKKWQQMCDVCLQYHGINKEPSQVCVVCSVVVSVSGSSTQASTNLN